VSFAEILEELPKLSNSERREICLKVLSFETETDDLAICDQVASEGFALLEEMEAEDHAKA
jgi:hypothetical protein